MIRKTFRLFAFTKPTYSSVPPQSDNLSGSAEKREMYGDPPKVPLWDRPDLKPILGVQSAEVFLCCAQPLIVCQHLKESDLPYYYWYESAQQTLYLAPLQTPLNFHERLWLRAVSFLQP